MADEIVRDDSKMQSKTLLPTREQHPLTLDPTPTSGLLALHRKATNKAPAINQTGYLTGRVLANKCPPNSTDGNSKYRLPHLNMEPGRELEDYLIYVALDEPASKMSTQDPEQIFLEMSKLSSGAQSKFEFDKNDPEKIKIWKKYMSSMVQHVTLAPKHASSIISIAPAPGTRVKVFLFQPHQLSSGTTIDGLYEKEYNNNIFNKGYDEMINFFKSFNQKLIDASNAMERAIDNLTHNVPSVQGQTPQGQANTGNSSGIVSETDARSSTAMNNSSLRQYINSLTEAQKYDYFSTFIPQNGGTFKTALNEKNIVAFRTQTNTHINNQEGQYDDLFFLIWLDSNGNKKVGQYIGNTEPAFTWTKKFGSLWRLKPGFLIYQAFLHPERGRVLILKPGTKAQIENDTNNNGLFDDGVEHSSNPQMIFHKGGNVSTWSAGCQTMPGDVFERFINDVYSGGPTNQELGYTLIDENKISIPESEIQMSTVEQAQNNPQENTAEIELEQNQTSAT